MRSKTFVRLCERWSTCSVFPHRPLSITVSPVSRSMSQTQAANTAQQQPNHKAIAAMAPSVVMPKNSGEGADADRPPRPSPETGWKPANSCRLGPNRRLWRKIGRRQVNRSRSCNLKQLGLSPGRNVIEAAPRAHGRHWDADVAGKVGNRAELCDDLRCGH